MQPVDLLAEMADRLDLHERRQRDATADLERQVTDLSRQLQNAFRGELLNTVESLVREIRQVADAVSSIQAPAAAAPTNAETADTVPVSSPFPSKCAGLFAQTYQMLRRGLGGYGCGVLQVDLEAMVTEIFPYNKFAPRSREELKAAVVRAAFLADPKRFRNKDTNTLNDDVVSAMVVKYKSQVSK